MFIFVLMFISCGPERAISRGSPRSGYVIDLEAFSQLKAVGDLYESNASAFKQNLAEHNIACNTDSAKAAIHFLVLVLGDRVLKEQKDRSEEDSEYQATFSRFEKQNKLYIACSSEAVLSEVRAVSLCLRYLGAPDRLRDLDINPSK